MAVMSRPLLISYPSLSLASMVVLLFLFGCLVLYLDKHSLSGDKTVKNDKGALALKMTSMNDEQGDSNQQVPTQSLTLMLPTTVSLDNIIRQCGGLGRYQWVQYFFLSLVQMTAGLSAFYYVYGAGAADHRCRLSPSIWPNDNHYNPINSTHQFFLNLYIPKQDGKWDQCHLFDSANMNKTLIECPDGWIFDRSVYGLTFTEAMNLVCRAKAQKSLIATLMQTAGFLVLIAGVLADRFGRKKITFGVSILIFTVCLAMQIAMQWISMPIKLQFAILLINQFMTGLTHMTSTVAFIMMLELTNSTHRGLVGNISFLSFVFGEVLITLFAYMARNWENLLWANTIFLGVSLPCLYFTDESPLYLYSKKQYTRLEKLLRRMAKTNLRKDIDWYPTFQELLSMQQFPTVNKKQLTFTQKIQQVISHRTTIQRILITSFVAFTQTLLYYKISYGLAAMKMSPYISILIGAVVEAIGYITANMLMSTQLGRKYSFIIFTGLTSACIFIVPFIMKHSTLSTVIISQIGKFGVSAANSVTWIYIAELFPTTIRSSTNGFAVAISRLGAIAAPLIDSSINEEFLTITFYIYAGLAFVSVLFTLLLPETKDQPLQDDIDYTSSSN